METEGREGGHYFGACDKTLTVETRFGYPSKRAAPREPKDKNPNCSNFEIESACGKGGVGAGGGLGLFHGGRMPFRPYKSTPFGAAPFYGYPNVE